MYCVNIYYIKTQILSLTSGLQMWRNVKLFFVVTPGDLVVTEDALQLFDWNGVVRFTKTLKTQKGMWHDSLYIHQSQY